MRDSASEGTKLELLRPHLVIREIRRLFGDLSQCTEAAVMLFVMSMIAQEFLPEVLTIIDYLIHSLCIFSPVAAAVSHIISRFIPKFCMTAAERGADTGLEAESNTDTELEAGRNVDAGLEGAAEDG